MMGTHQFSATCPRTAATAVAAPRVWSAPVDGQWQVTAGRVWITRDGDARDHVLGAGDQLALQAGDRIVMEAWRPGETACLRWQDQGPRGTGQRVRLRWQRRLLTPAAALLVPALRGVARLADAGARHVAQAAGR
jgi:hypothetical protein